MRGNIITKVVILSVVLAFGLGASLALAAQQWCLDKNSKGVCSVRECAKATKTTIAGPFPTKDAAMKAKEEKCPPKTPTKKTPPAPK